MSDLFKACANCLYFDEYDNSSESGWCKRLKSKQRDLNWCKNYRSQAQESPFIAFLMAEKKRLGFASNEEFSVFCGLSPLTLALLKNGNAASFSGIQVRTIFKIASALKTDPVNLFTIFLKSYYPNWEEKCSKI